MSIMAQQQPHQQQPAQFAHAGTVAGARIPEQTARAIINAAIQTPWDIEFTGNERITNWLVEQVQRFPFDPRRLSLLDYVKHRMAAAKQEQAQQQPQLQLQQQGQGQQQQFAAQHQQQAGVAPQALQAPPQQQQQHYAQPQYAQPQPQSQFGLHSQQQPQPAASTSSFSTLSYTTAPPSSSNPPSTSISQQPLQQQQTASTSNQNQNHNVYTIMSDDDDSSGHESDDQQYQFGLNDLAASTSNSNQQQQAQDQLQSQPSSFQAQQAMPAMSTPHLFPFANTHNQAASNNRPFAQAAGSSPSNSQTYYQHQALPVSGPSTGLNPALLALNNGANGVASPSTPSHIAPHQLANQHIPYANGSSKQANGAAAPQASTSSQPSTSKSKSRVEVEIMVPSAAKRKKNKEPSASESGRQPLSATSVQPQKKQKGEASSAAAAGSTSGSPSQPASILAVPTYTPRPPTKAEQEWFAIKKEVTRNMQQANKAPHKTVMKLFKLLAPFVTEPPDATSRQGSREAYTTDLAVPTEARLAILDIIRDETNNDFDIVFVVDPRATVLLHTWTKDLALIAKKKYEGEEDVKTVKMTARPLMEVLRKLPITLDVLRSLKGVGADVNSVSKSDAFDHVAKDIACQLVKKWMSDVKRASAPAASRAGSQPPPPPASTTSAAGKKRQEDSLALPNGTADESRKKRRVSPTPPTSKDTAAVTTSASTSAAKSGSTSIGNGPTTQPLGRLPTHPKPGTTGKTMPSFAKRKPIAGITAKPAPPPKPAAPAAPAAAAFDPFAMSLQDMAASKDSAASGMSLNDTLSMLNKAVDNASSKSGSGHVVPRAGKKKSVRWAEDDKLVLVKFVEKLIYGDEYGNEIASSDYFNTTGETVGENEGVAMKGLVEQMDWEEPQVVDLKLPEDALEFRLPYPHPESLGSQRCERDIQEDREKTTLATTYFSDADIPPCPDETLALAAMADSTEADIEPAVMRLSYELQNDQAVQLLILQAQTVADGAASAGGETYARPSDAAVAGTPDLNALLAKLQGGGGIESLDTLNAHQPHVPPAPAVQHYGGYAPQTYGYRPY